VLELGGKRLYLPRPQAMPPRNRHSAKARNWDTILRVLERVAGLYKQRVLGVTNLYCMRKPYPEYYRGASLVSLGEWEAWVLPGRFTTTFIVELGAENCPRLYVTIMHWPGWSNTRRIMDECFEMFRRELLSWLKDSQGD
jgi:hypothetical protein